MNDHELAGTARQLVAGGKGLRAMDESNPTCNARFAEAGIPQTEDARRAYRELIVTTPGLGECISGAILYDETIRQSTTGGIRFAEVLIAAGVVPGIKVDTGAKDLAGHPREKVTEGLDGLRARLQGYWQLGARFGKWRAVLTVTDTHSSRGCVEVNAHALARYAALCQEAGLVPIIEPEVLMTGGHTLARCHDVMEAVMLEVFDQLHKGRPDWNVFRDGCPDGETPQQVSDRADRLIARLHGVEGNVALFSHGQFGCVLGARWIGLAAVDGQHLSLGPASLSILGHRPGYPGVRAIALWNAAPASLFGGHRSAEPSVASACIATAARASW